MTTMAAKIPNGVGGNGQTAPIPWAARAGELAAWVKGHTMVRDDAYAEHYIDEEAKLQKRWVRKNLMLERLERHFRAATQQDVAAGSIISLAAMALAPGGESSYTRETVIDVDCHDGKNQTATQRAAFAWFDALAKLSFRPILENSSINSYHLRIVFNQDLETGKARSLMMWVTRDWKDYGLTRAPEVFPKTDTLTADGAGSLSVPLRLFGRCPKYEFWSKVYSGFEWLDDDGSIDWILNTSGDDPSLIPNDAIQYKKQLDQDRKRQHKEIDQDNERPDVARVKDALSYYKNADLHYDDWINIGLSLNNWDATDEVGLKLWVEWSKTSSKHRDGACEKAWGSFTPDCLNGRTIKSLFNRPWTADGSPRGQVAAASLNRPMILTGSGESFSPGSLGLSGIGTNSTRGKDRHIDLCPIVRSTWGSPRSRSRNSTGSIPSRSRHGRIGAERTSGPGDFVRGRRFARSGLA